MFLQSATWFIKDQEGSGRGAMAHQRYSRCQSPHRFSQPDRPSDSDAASHKPASVYPESVGDVESAFNEFEVCEEPDTRV